MRRSLDSSLAPLALIGLWAAVQVSFAVPDYLLPSPFAVAEALWRHWPDLWRHSQVTMLEIGLGLAIGAPLGAYLAHISLARPLAHRLVTLAAVAVQAIPVFAIAPLLVLWLGYGLASKIAMTTLIVFFPVLSAARDGLGRTPQSLLSAAQVMARGSSKAQRRIVTQIRWPAALPSVFSGLKIAAATAPIAAVIGEWVGASEGLGYAMLRANSRAETDIVFAALILLIALGIALHALAELCARWAIPWAYTDQETD